MKFYLIQKKKKLTILMAMMHLLKQEAQVFQRVLGGDHPPYLIDFEAVESCTTDVQMTFVRRVEGAA